MTWRKTKDIGITEAIEQIGVSPERLRYWEAFRASFWWLIVLALQSSDSFAALLKPDVRGRIPAGYLAQIQRYFWQRARG